MVTNQAGVAEAISLKTWSFRFTKLRQELARRLVWMPSTIVLITPQWDQSRTAKIAIVVNPSLVCFFEQSKNWTLI